MLLNDYIKNNDLKADNRWGKIMPVVRKIGEELLTYWGKEQDTEAWAIQVSIEFCVVNVQYPKLEKWIEKGIEFLKQKQNEVDTHSKSSDDPVEIEIKFTP